MGSEVTEGFFETVTFIMYMKNNHKILQRITTVTTLSQMTRLTRKKHNLHKKNKNTNLKFTFNDEGRRSLVKV